MFPSHVISSSTIDKKNSQWDECVCVCVCVCGGGGGLITGAERDQIWLESVMIVIRGAGGAAGCDEQELERAMRLEHVCVCVCVCVRGGGVKGEAQKFPCVCVCVCVKKNKKKTHPHNHRNKVHMASSPPGATVAMLLSREDADWLM